MSMVKEMRWQEFSKSGEIRTKQKAFPDGKALDKFLERLEKKDNFYRVLAFR